MALNLPDITICNTVNTCLTTLRTDYNTYVAAGQEERSMLYLLFNGLQLGQYDFYANIKELIITTPQNPKHIECQLSIDHNSQGAAPIIWVTLPNENNRSNSIGVGEGNQDELLFANDPDQDEYRKQFNYRWATTYQVVIGAENKNASTALYHLIKSMMIACIGHFDAEGISNLKIGGGDIRLQQVPDRFFTKTITLNFEYEQVIPEIFISNIYRTLRLYWKPEGAEVAQGPIEISVDDDVSPSISDSQS